jgi:purine-binding chemotaxis protein CheW
MSTLTGNSILTPDNAAILQARARALAREVQADLRTAEGGEFVEFTAARVRFAAETSQVREVCRLQDLTPVPCTPPFVCGIVNVRGQILTVLDLKRLLDLPDQGLVDRQHVVIVHADGVELGLLADGTPAVRRVRSGDTQPAPPTLTPRRAAYVRGVTPDGLAVLDVARLLADPEIVVHQEISAPTAVTKTTGDSAS